MGHVVVSTHGRWLAAVLSVGPDAALSARSAAALWELRPVANGPVEVIVPRSLKPRRGLLISRAQLAADERTQRAGIPVTTPPRTLLDLASVLPRHQLERAAEQAEQLRLVDAAALDALLSRHPRRRGTASLRRIAAAGRTGRITRSELEARFLTFLADFDLPAPDTNVRVEVAGVRLELDCVWPDAWVVVELDGHAYHSSRAAFERDRERDRRLQAAGWRVVRVTWRQLRDQPEAVARDLRRLLRTAGRP